MEGAYQPITEGGNTFPQGQQPQVPPQQGQPQPQPQYYPPQPQGYYGQQPAYGANPYQPQGQPYYGAYPQMGQPYVPVAASALRTPVRVRFASSCVMLIFSIVLLSAPGWYFQVYSDTYNVYTADLGIWTLCTDQSCFSICQSDARGSDCAKFRGMRATLIITLIALVADLALLVAPLMNKGYHRTRRIAGVSLTAIVSLLLLVTLALGGAVLGDLPGFKPFFCFFLCIPTLIFGISSVVFSLRVLNIQDPIAPQ